MTGQVKISVSKLPPGYAFDMGQPSIGISIILDGLSHFSTAAAHDALSEVFELSSDGIPPLGFLEPPDLPAYIIDFLQCGFALARSLLQEIGLPAFAQEKIHSVLRLHGTQSAYRLQFNAPAIENFDRTHIAAAYSNSLRLMSIFSAQTPDRKAFKASADALAENFVIPLRPKLGRGLSTKHILNEAFNRGIPITHLGHGTYQLGFGIHGRIINKSATDADSALGANTSKRKDVSEAWFKSIGVPVPETRSVRDVEDAVVRAREIGFPVVLKPADLDRSEGVFLELSTEEEVRAAYEQARKLSPNILVQSEIPGHCHRLVTFKGKFVFAYSRLPAAVVGDGESSIRTLVEQSNQKHWKKAKHLQTRPLPFDDVAFQCLAEQGFGPDDVLEPKKVVFLRNKNVLDFAAHNEIVTDTVHPENKALVERLAKLFRLESVGADLISTDPTRPWYETGAAITEINFQPQVGGNTARSNFDAMFPEGSRGLIPIECFVGGQNAMETARKRLGALAADNVQAALTSHDISLDSRGNPMHLAHMSGLRDRCSVFLRDPEIEALIVVVQTDEFAISGPPFYGDVEVIHVDNDVHRVAEPSERLSEAVLAQLPRVLQGG